MMADWNIIDGFEVWPVEVNEAGDCECLVGHADVHRATVWSVYGHLKDGGLICITDATTKKLAYAVMTRLQEVSGF